MDCGPASLKCLLEGFDISVSYARLRETCHTDVDGTSISTMAAIACDLGLDAEEIMLPVEHVFANSAQALPAIAVVRIPNGSIHFAVLWRKHGSLCQLMDPASGRIWKSSTSIERELYVHTMNVPAEGWREWAGSDEFVGALSERLAAIGVRGDSRRLIQQALADPTWRSLGTLDAAVRFASGLDIPHIFGRSFEASSLLDQLIVSPDLIPDEAWSVKATQSEDSDGEAELRMRGAVVVRARRRRPVDASHQTTGLAAHSAARSPRPVSAALHLLSVLRADGFTNIALLLSIWFVQATGVALEAVLFRGLLGMSTETLSRWVNLESLATVAGFAALMVLVTVPGTMSVLRFGRLLENRLRIALFLKLPRLSDRYFQSRLTADVAERSHSINHLRVFPHLAATIVGSSFEMLLTTAGMIWLDPKIAPLAVFACLSCAAVPLLVQPMIAERDLRVRSHVGALARFYLESMVGLAAIRAHSAESAVREEHYDRLSEWARASLRLLRVSAAIDGLQLTLGSIFGGAILLWHLTSATDSATSLLLVYWALNLPLLGSGLAAAIRQYPIYRNITMRLLEPLSAPDAETSGGAPPGAACDVAPQITFADVAVSMSGYTLLNGVTMKLDPGEHVAIVGRSGAGKSSLVGLLLGWYTPTRGTILIDGGELTPRAQVILRQKTAWVDPAIQIWNRSLLENLCYGASPEHAASLVGSLVEAADLATLLGMLPDGLQTHMGEGGGLVSGGEGQRVRLGRAMNRADARLVILDEAFRGLDSERRTTLVARSRKLWKDATLLCITHDVHDALDFPRVLVLDRGVVVEDGAPHELARAEGAFASLLGDETRVRLTLQDAKIWRTLRVEGGQLVEH